MVISHRGQGGMREVAQRIVVAGGDIGNLRQSVETCKFRVVAIKNLFSHGFGYTKDAVSRYYM